MRVEWKAGGGLVFSSLSACSALPEFGEFELQRAIELPVAFGIPGLVVDQEDVAAGPVAPIAEGIDADDLSFGVPLHEAAQEEVGRKSVEETAAECIGFELTSF